MATHSITGLPVTDYAQEVIAAIAGNVGERELACTVCRNSGWDVQLYHGSLPAIDPSGEDFGRYAASFPMAVVVCETCGYTMMFNLFRLGIAERLGIYPASP